MRPLSVTLAAWALMLVSMLGFGGLALVTAHLGDLGMMTFVQNSPVPVMGVLVWCGAGLFISFLAGKFILAGKNWARVLFTVWAVVNLALSIFLAQSVATMVIVNIFAMVVVLFLFLPRANRYFRRRHG